MPIRILDAATVGRIAAGEVVERPASVVKELMENALDAGATAITVEIKGGGIELIRVTDNGCGIEQGQVRLAFENHATSKLQNAEQLDDIRTLGFRGEALPSIAAVAHVEMTTRARGQESGTRVSVDGGQNLRVREIGCPEGTTLVVRDLFYNIPVRRAFLKKPAYEGGLVHDVVARLMIGNPDVSVRFISNGSTQFHSYGDHQLRHAVFAAYDKQTAEQMIAVDAMEGGTRIRGLIGIGDLAKNSRAHELFFINGRSVRCALLSKALEQVCRSRVTIGLYPMCALHLVLPPNAVDVNVHPNKLEVRFSDEENTRETVERLLNSAFQGERVLDFARDTAPVKPVERVAKVERIDPKPIAPAAPAAQKTPAMPPLPNAARREEAPTKPVQTRLFDSPASLPRELPNRLREAPEGSVAHGPVQVIGAEKAVAPRQDDLPTPYVNEELPPYKVVGVAFDTYIVLEFEDSLLVIDQHAAHERLRYEMYNRQLEEGTASQRLLVPLVLRLSAREMALIRENQSVLEESGYAIEPFGEQDIRVTAVPHVLGKAELRPIFMDMLHALSRLKAATLDARRAEIMQMSCKGAVKGGDSLSEGEIRSLIAQMLETGAPPTCPHGRPVVRSVPKRELEKWFKRIQ
ncbi:MAG: DNA mismatch repair endonuclease MutL [Clostridia bacterium]|nr:DNA mismatch repair endonuclease MutL [Clostridia bacterium]